ncbi:LGFP repeat-containing protein [Microbacterium sp. NPDC055903]
MLRIARILAVFAAVLAVSVSTVTPLSAASATTVTAGVGAVQPARAVGDIAASGLAKTTLVGFNAGNIISDAVFTKKSTMTEAQIQTFLNSKVKTCRSGYTCLKDLKTATQSKAADKYCSAYAGAKSESAARIIYKVAQACGINPQVLIVMLQKEQGLVTHTWPSDWRYNAAMGQACPDTAPCNVAFAGFFAQVYGAARQMQIYMDGVYFTWYAPGKTWNVLYHPNASCGRGAVKIANKATSALYYYTPYQPNAASLAAGYGTGNSCSSYGNRNFYNYFTDWFGSTQSAPAPAYTVAGAIATEWKARGGATGNLGNPLAAAQVVTDPNGNGLAQKFQGGWIHSSSTGTFTSWTAIMTEYSAAGWLRGDLGWPVSNQVCTSGICTQPFQGGIIAYPTGGKATTTLGISPDAITAEHTARGGAKGSLGAALAAVQIISDPQGNGLARKYAGGWIHSSEAGTFASSTAIMTAYSAAGWVRGSLGWPTGAETCSNGLCSQPFEDGVIAYSSGKAAVALPGVSTANVKTVLAASQTGIGAAAAPVQLVTDPNGNGLARKYAGGWIHASESGTFTTATALMTAYSKAGWLRGSLGWPIAAQQTVTDPNGNGLAQQFDGGWIHSSSAGAFSSSSTVMTAYSAAGWVRGTLGWPAGAEFCTGNGCVQSFGGGLIGYVKGKAAAAIPGATAKAVTSAASAASLGKSLATLQVVADINGAGLAQKFTNGWVHSSEHGTFASSTAVMTAYSGAGWVRGKLGWPISAETCTGTACVQAFEGGVISYVKGKQASVALGVTDAAVTAAAKKAALGSSDGASQLVADVSGSGLAQKFAGGWVHSSKNGTFASSATVMTAYSATGWVRGKLGWPTGSEACTATLCTQTFQGGTISYAPGGAATATLK